MSKRFLTVGSLLRPKILLEYKHEIEHRDDIKYPFYDDFKGYKKIEDETIKELVEEQKKRNFPEITDGEFSKSLWHLDFVWGLKGVRRFIDDKGYFFRENDSDEKFETRKDIGIEIVGELSGKNHPFIEHYKRLKEYAGDNYKLKQCIPSPSHIYGELLLSNRVGDKVYKTAAEFEVGLINAYKEFISEFAEIGGKILQFDDCLWEIFSADNDSSPFKQSSTKPENNPLAQTFIAINNDVIDYAHSLGLKVYTHNCRGNYDSKNMADGTYESIAGLFLEKQNYDRFYLEWDDERAGSIDALKAFKNKKNVEVVLGLLSSKTNTLDDEKRTLSLLEKATKYIDKDNLYLSHQCGFASCDCGNRLTIEEQWAKVEQGQEIARKFWGE